MKSLSSPHAKRLFTAAATASMVGALALTGASSASAAQNDHLAQQTPAFPALPEGAHVLKSGTNQYGSYEFVAEPEPIGALHGADVTIRPANGGGCNSDSISGVGSLLTVCAAVTGSGLKIDQMTNKSYFYDASSGDAEVQILSPTKAQLASWWGYAGPGGQSEVTAYWTPNRNEPAGWYCAATTWSNDDNPSASDCVQVS